MSKRALNKDYYKIKGIKNKKELDALVDKIIRAREIVYALSLYMKDFEEARCISTKLNNEMLKLRKAIEPGLRGLHSSMRDSKKTGKLKKGGSKRATQKHHRKNFNMFLLWMLISLQISIVASQASTIGVTNTEIDKHLHTRKEPVTEWEAWEDIEESTEQVLTARQRKNRTKRDMISDEEEEEEEEEAEVVVVNDMDILRPNSKANKHSFGTRIFPEQQAEEPSEETKQIMNVPAELLSSSAEAVAYENIGNNVSVSFPLNNNKYGVYTKYIPLLFLPTQTQEWYAAKRYAEEFNKKFIEARSEVYSLDSIQRTCTNIFHRTEVANLYQVATETLTNSKGSFNLKRYQHYTDHLCKYSLPVMKFDIQEDLKAGVGTITIKISEKHDFTKLIEELERLILYIKKFAGEEDIDSDKESYLHKEIDKLKYICDNVARLKLSLQEVKEPLKVVINSAFIMNGYFMDFLEASNTTMSMDELRIRQYGIKNKQELNFWNNLANRENAMSWRIFFSRNLAPLEQALNSVSNSITGILGNTVQNISKEILGPILNALLVGAGLIALIIKLKNALFAKPTPALQYQPVQQQQQLPPPPAYPQVGYHQGYPPQGYPQIVYQQGYPQHPTQGYQQIGYSQNPTHHHHRRHGVRAARSSSRKHRRSSHSSMSSISSNSSNSKSNRNQPILLPPPTSS